jgi:hypothetical protein
MSGRWRSALGKLRILSGVEVCKILESDGFQESSSPRQPHRHAETHDRFNDHDSGPRSQGASDRHTSIDHPSVASSAVLIRNQILTVEP